MQALPDELLLKIGRLSLVDTRFSLSKALRWKISEFVEKVTRSKTLEEHITAKLKSMFLDGNSYSVYLPFSHDLGRWNTRIYHDWWEEMTCTSGMSQGDGPAPPIHFEHEEGGLWRVDARNQILRFSYVNQTSAQLKIVTDFIGH